MRLGHRYYYYPSVDEREEGAQKVVAAFGAALGRTLAPGLEALDTFFWSGLSSTTTLGAAATSGQNVGVGVSALSGKEAKPLGPSRINAIARLPKDKLVFIDSGAYSAEERGGIDLDRHMVQFRRAGGTAFVPAWEFIFEKYGEIVGSRPPGTVFVVAADKVKSQRKTLGRIAKHARHLRELSDAGAQIIVPLQPGKLSLAEMSREVDKLLRFPWVPGLAVKGSPRYFTPKVLRAFVLARRPSRVHLLGVGPAVSRRTRASGIIPALRLAAAEVHAPILVQSDSALTRTVRAAIGQYRRGVRPHIRMDIPDLLEPIEVGAGEYKLPSGTTFDYTEQWAEAFDQLPDAQLYEIAEDLWIAHDEAGPEGLTSKEQRAFVADPSGFLTHPPRRLGICDDDAFNALSYTLWSDNVRRVYEDETTSRWLSGDMTRLQATRSAGMERLARAPEPLPQTIALIACGAGKKPGYAPARELYTGSIFRAVRKHIEGRHLPYFILSGKHGLLDPTQRVRKYEGELPASLAKRTKWAQSVIRQLKTRLGPLRGLRFELHAGHKYREPLLDLLEQQGAWVSTPVKGFNIFALQRHYARRRA